MEKNLENISFEIKEGKVLTILRPELKLFPYKGEVEWRQELKLVILLKDYFL